jgi:sulfide dehydrogenase cytochrome subunit
MPLKPLTTHLLLGCIGLASIQTAVAEDDFYVNRLLASQCAQCHGTSGYAVGDMDDLAGESEKDLYEDLQDMRFEDRPENIMDHQALGYTEDQIRRIATFYATIPESKREEDKEEDEDEREED